jgi:hypothetical protein
MPIVKIKNCINCHMPHEWLFLGPKLKEMRTIKKLTGFTGMDFIEAADSLDPDAVTALLYILHQRDKITVPFDDIDIDFEDFDMIETEQEKKERLIMEREQKKADTQQKSQNGPTQRAVSRHR